MPYSDVSGPLNSPSSSNAFLSAESIFNPFSSKASLYEP